MVSIVAEHDNSWRNIRKSGFFFNLKKKFLKTKNFQKFNFRKLVLNIAKYANLWQNTKKIEIFSILKKNPKLKNFQNSRILKIGLKRREIF